jgi:DinB superfamily
VPAPLLTPDEIIAILSGTVARIAELSDGHTEQQLNAEPESGAWSANVLLAHLRACQDVLGGSIVRILREDRPAWKRISPREWHRKSGYNESSFGPAFEAFAQGRAELLGNLDSMGREDWERIALVTVQPNRSLEQTARFFGDWLAGHEQVHLEQIAQTIRAVSAKD